MKPSLVFFKNCVFWLSQVSTYISRINKINNQLESLMSSSLSVIEEEKTRLIMQRINAALKNLSNTETRIIHTIKKNENYPANIYVPLSETRFAVYNEKYLSKLMRYHYSLFKELESAGNEY